MKPTEDHIRKKLGHQTPPSLNAEDLWADIAAGLPAEGTKPPVVVPHNANGWQRYLPLLLVVLVLVGGLTTWWLAQPTDSAEGLAATQELATTTNQPSATPAKVIPGVSLQSSPAAPTETSSQQPSSSQHETVATPQGGGETDLQTDLPVTAPTAPIVTGQETTEHPITQSEPVMVSSLPNDNVGGQITAKADQFKSFDIEKVAGLAMIDHVDYNSPLPDASTTATPFRTTSRQRLSAGVHLGSNILLRKYATSGDDTGAQLNRSTGQMVGQTGAIDLRYRLTDYLTVGTGIDYHRTGNTFQHVSEWDTLIPHPTPPNTGLINAVARRSVAHNNREELLSIPLLVSYERQFGDFTAGLGAGVGLNWQTRASGRTLNTNGRIVNYDAPLQRNFFLSWQVQPRLSWQPNAEKPWAVQLRLDAARFTLQQSAITGTQQRGWLFGAALGVRYRLGR